jgi:hypothetical protein
MAQNADASNPLGLLCARCERPRDRNAEQRDEIAACPASPPQSVCRTLSLP